MMPKPPHWMSSRMHAWPGRVKSRGVSSTVRPVTQTALTAVKAASTRAMGRPFAAPGQLQQQGAEQAQAEEGGSRHPRRMVEQGFPPVLPEVTGRPGPGQQGQGGARLAAMAAALPVRPQGQCPAGSRDQQQRHPGDPLQTGAGQGRPAESLGLGEEQGCEQGGVAGRQVARVERCRAVKARPAGASTIRGRSAGDARAD